MEFEKENDIMDQRQEMMDDAIDDVTGLEDEEEGEEVVNQVLDEIGVDLGQSVSLDKLRDMCTVLCSANSSPARRDSTGIAEECRRRGEGCTSCGRRRWRRHSG